MRDNALHLEAVIDIAKMAFRKDEQRLAVARDIAAECSAVTDEDRCELAYKLMICAIESAASRGINFRDFL